jgi:MoaA/NifB/PqqE/SkfB family radical SAM enzyme
MSFVIPETLTLEVTRRCNLACPYCFALAAWDHLSDLEWDAALEVVERAARLGISRLHLTGGEPTLWKPLFLLIDRAAELGFRSMHINTNGDFLRGEILSKLRERKDFVRLTISLNGPREMHDASRGKGTHARTRSAIGRALAAGIVTDVFTTVDRDLMKILPGFARDLFQDFPTLNQWVLIQVHRVAGDVHDLESNLLSPEDFIRLAVFADGLALAGKPVGFLDNPLANCVSDAMGPGALGQSRPKVRDSHIAVLQDLRITALHSSREALGRFREEGLLAALPRLRAAAERLGAACDPCVHRDACARGGNLQPSDAGVSIDPRAPFCRRVMDMVLLQECSKPSDGNGED